MTDGDTLSHQQKAAQKLREAKHELQEMDLNDMGIGTIIISILLVVMEEYLSEQYERTKGRSQE